MAERMHWMIPYSISVSVELRENNRQVDYLFLVVKDNVIVIGMELLWSKYLYSH